MNQHSSKYIHNASILLILSLWCQCSAANYSMRRPGDIDLNPNILCPGKNVRNSWPTCKHGGYIVNHDPKNCADRYVCYIGLNEFCNRGDRCADNAMCTSCGRCQKCESPEKCSDFLLCPNSLFKRFMQKRLIEYNDDEGEIKPTDAIQIDIEYGERYEHTK